MIQLAAQTAPATVPAGPVVALSLAPSIAGAGAQPGAGTAQIGGFADLLQQTGAVPQGPAVQIPALAPGQPSLPGADMARDAAAEFATANPTALVQLQADPAMPAMPAGKILPALAAAPANMVNAAPEAAETGEAATLRLQLLPQAAPALAATVRQIRVQLAAPARPAAATTTAASDEDADADADAALAATPADAPATAPAAADPSALQPLAVLLAGLTDQARSAPVPAQAGETAPGPDLSAQPARLPGLIAAQLQGLPLPAPAALRQDAAPAAAPAPTASPAGPAEDTVSEAGATRLVSTAVQRPDLARAAAFTLSDRPAEALPGAIHLRLQPGEKTPSTAEGLSIAPAAAPAYPDASALFPQPAMTDASVSSAAMAGAPTLSAATGHDFGAIVDRLIEARDMARPQDVNVAINHAEFGQVSLHFRQDDAGLSVSVASPDPDFARAVNAATAPASADGANANSSGNGSNASTQQQAFQAGANGQSPQGQNSPARSASRGADAPAANPGSAGQTDSEEPAQRRGRFA